MEPWSHYPVYKWQEIHGTSGFGQNWKGGVARLQDHTTPRSPPQQLKISALRDETSEVLHPCSYMRWLVFNCSSCLVVHVPCSWCHFWRFPVLQRKNWAVLQEGLKAFPFESKTIHSARIQNNITSQHIWHLDTKLAKHHMLWLLWSSAATLSGWIPRFAS